MSKYYKAEDIEREIERLLRLGTTSDFEFGIAYGIETLERRLKDLPTIEVSEDCISREWVLKAIDAEDVGTPDEMRRPAREYVEMIKNAPSVVMKDHSGEPTEMVGEWLHKRMPHDSYHITGQCSTCKERSRINNYCPWCGAKMKG